MATLRLAQTVLLPVDDQDGPAERQKTNENVGDALLEHSDAEALVKQQPLRNLFHGICIYNSFMYI